ncbi:MAG TPA: NADP-specific glutamate dehydrogenase [Acidimicrobiales bacterium]|nr:NADP-specific glutamate dehydrogenase [Acidimicrobiales bacterium]
MDGYVEGVLERVRAKNPGQPEFLQAVELAAVCLVPVLDRRRDFREAKILERLAEPERVIIFRVNWVDDADEVQINRGFRVQMNSAIGPYKGGLRFHPTVDLSVLKFLAFEQVLKNALTTLPLGGAKGGSDFDPKGKSDAEVRRFCQSFMTELARHIGQFTDIPAGDIGVGGREIGFLFGQHKRITNQFTGVMTGKEPDWGGSFIRTEATGYGTVYFAAEMLATKGEDLTGKSCLVSGSGNVAQYTAQKLLDMGARLLTMSDSGGFVLDPDGIDRDKLDWLMDMKNVRRGRIREYAERFPRSTYVPAQPNGENPLWDVPADCAFPCATQNEIGAKDAANLLRNGVVLVAEGANMPTTSRGVELFVDAGILYGPAKAANAGGVAVSGLEMAQDSAHLPWPTAQVDAKLRAIMRDIHGQVRRAAEEYGAPGNYVAGANIAGFVKVAGAMLDEGTI